MASFKLKTIRSGLRERHSGVLLDRFSPTIYISGEVTHEMADDFLRALNELENTRSTDAVMIKLDSVGGSVTEGFRMLNAMKSSPLSIATYCVGTAYSMGAVLMSAGKPGMRFAAPLSHFMVHSVASGNSGRIEELRVGLKGLEQVNSLVMGELARNCKKSVKQLEDAIRETGSTDLFMTPWEAQKFGLVDHVANVGLMKAESYQLQIDTIADPSKPKKESKPKQSEVKKQTPKPVVQPQPEPEPEPKPKRRSGKLKTSV